MDDALLPFVIESVLCSTAIFILLFFSLKQVHYDLTTGEKWRALTATHSLTFISIIILCVLFIDSSGGLRIYSVAGALFMENFKAYIIIASFSALATSYLEGYQIMISQQKSLNLGKILFAMHTVFLSSGLALYVALAATRYIMLSIIAQALLLTYVIVVAAQITHAATRIRSLLVKERNEKYKNAIRRLTRLLVIVFILIVVALIGIVVQIADDLEKTKTQSRMSTEPAPYQAFHIVSDILNLVGPALLMFGAWKTRANGKKTTTSKKSSTNTGEIRRLELAMRDENSRAQVNSHAPEPDKTSRPDTQAEPDKTSRPDTPAARDSSAPQSDRAANHDSNAPHSVGVAIDHDSNPAPEV